MAGASAQETALKLSVRREPTDLEGDVHVLYSSSVDLNRKALLIIYHSTFIASRAIMYYTHWLWIVLSLVAAVLAWVPTISHRLEPNTRFAVRLLSTLVLYFVAIHMIGFPLPRYSIPLRPSVFGLAVFTLYGAWHYVVSRRVLRLRQRTGTRSP